MPFLNFHFCCFNHGVVSVVPSTSSSADAAVVAACAAVADAAGASGSYGVVSVASGTCQLYDSESDTETLMSCRSCCICNAC